MNDKLILALDVSIPGEACDMVQKYRERVHAFKVGLELFNAVGPDIFHTLRVEGAKRIFYDAKLFDIPNTVERAARVAAWHGLWMITVHARGTRSMMEAALRGAQQGSEDAGYPHRPLVIAVTKLTSEPSWPRRAGYDMAMEAVEARMDGVICPVPSASAIRQNAPPGFLIATPGIRLAGEPQDDHNSCGDPEWALEAGVDYMVIGRRASSILETK